MPYRWRNLAVTLLAAGQLLLALGPDVWHATQGCIDRDCAGQMCKHDHAACEHGPSAWGHGHLSCGHQRHSALDVDEDTTPSGEDDRPLHGPDSCLACRLKAAVRAQAFECEQTIAERPILALPTVQIDLHLFVPALAEPFFARGPPLAA